MSVLKEKKASYWSVKKPAFLFGLAPREGCGVTSEQLGHAMLWLEDALMFWGIGAKTATGYGHMDKDEAGVEKQRQELQSQEEARKEQARLATMAPEEVAMDAMRQRMERGESQGAGAGCPLGNDLSQLFTQAKSQYWGSDLLETLIALGKSIYQHLGVDLKKNKKFRRSTLHYSLIIYDSGSQHLWVLVCSLCFSISGRISVLAIFRIFMVHFLSAPATPENTFEPLCNLLIAKDYFNARV